MPFAARFAVGDRVGYTSQRGTVLATVRFTDAQAGVVGIEFDTPGYGTCDGTHPKTRAALFRCPPNMGLYMNMLSKRLTPVAAPSHRDPQGAMKAMKRLGVGLEAMQEDETLRFTRQTSVAESALRSAEWGAGLEFRKCWDHASQQYLYFERSQERSRGLKQLPPGAVVTSVEGGPEAKEVLPQTYRGPQLQKPQEVTPEEAFAIYEFVCTRWREVLPAPLMLRLARAGREAFAKEPTVQRIAVPQNGKLVVVGDTHGHLKDLLHIWKLQGPPGPKRHYLFNGDICDRADNDVRGGQQALHIWACVLAYKIAYPGCVFMNRGNHEDAKYWRQYGASGFSGEIESKYAPREVSPLVDAFRDLVEELPLCAVLEKSVLVCHGGLPRFWEGMGAVRLAEIDRLKRPLSMPATPGNRREYVIYDLAWADPHDQLGVGPNDRGGAIVSWGPDVSYAFLQHEGLRLMIRSHELPGRGDEVFDGCGFEWWHAVADGPGCAPGGRRRATKVSAKPLQPLRADQEGWCLTIFSASDYCGTPDQNASAHVVFDSNITDFRIVEHQGWEAEVTLLSLDKPSERRMSVSCRTPEMLNSLLEQSFISRGKQHAELIEVIIRHKHRLLAEFMAADVDHDWHLAVPDFLACCYRELPLIPWEEVMRGDPDGAIVPVQSGLVRYTHFLTRYQVRFRNKLGKHAGFRRSLTNSLYDSLLTADHTLRDTFALIDTDGDGKVSVEEFGSALEKFGKVLNQEQVGALYRTTIASEGSVSIEDFLGGLSVRFAITAARPTTEANAFVPGLLDLIGRQILDRYGTAARGPSGRRGSAAPLSAAQVLRSFFEQSDSDGDGHLSHQEFLAAIRDLPCCRQYSDMQLGEVASYIDYDRNGRINYLETLCALNVRHDEGDQGRQRRQGPSQLVEDLLEAVYRVLRFEYSKPLRSLLHNMVAPGSTRCTPALFEAALTTLNRGDGGGHLTEGQIRCLISTLDVDTRPGEPSPHFDFEEFFASFEVVDTVLDDECESGLAG
eukprot:TRINITY_DN60049_c0_g1_i1.p1 TRINITY_DN60049_c0_g1~~TRINITY_DN60049_c0_g1_i1.p1  ORF type:complete len:1041 (+),score=335.37 TRINITY_DN60049_c0_g1_i1:85-3123(+)